MEGVLSFVAAVATQLGAVWSSLVREMSLADWLDVILAVATIMLAVATFKLARYARLTAEDSGRALDVFRAQAAASARQVDVAERALKAQVDQMTRQMRVHLTWKEGSEKDATVLPDPRHYIDGNEEKKAIAVIVDVKNMSAVAAYLDRIEHGPTVTTYFILDEYVLGGSEGKVELFIGAEVGQVIAPMPPERLRLHFASTGSGEATFADAYLHANAKIVVEHPGGGGPVHKVDGWILVTPEAHKPVG